MEYFISVNNDKRGPYSGEELKARGITSETLVMADGSSQWMPAWQVEELRPIITVPEPPTSDVGTIVTPQTANESQSQNNADSQPIDGFVEVDNPEPGFQQGRPVTPTPPPYSQPPMEEKRGSRVSTFLIVLIVIAAIAGLAIATCPDTDSHKAALTNVISAAVNDEANSSDSTAGSDDAIDKMFRQISDSWTQRVIATAVDNLIHVDNHIFYSTGKVRYDGKDHTVSVGAFGHVFTVDKEDIKAAAEQYYTKAERETKEDIRKKAEKIINDNVIDPAAQAIKEMVNGAMNDIIQDIGITGGSSDQQDEDEPADSTNI